MLTQKVGVIGRIVDLLGNGGCMLIIDRFNVAMKEEAICCCFEHFDTKKKKNFKNYIGFLLHLFIQNKKQSAYAPL